MVMPSERGRSGYQVVDGACCARLRGGRSCCAVRARKRSGAGARRVRVDGTSDPVDGGRADLREFDGDAGLGAEGARVPVQQPAPVGGHGPSA